MNINNPGNWSEYTFRPEFAKKDKGGNYTCHTLPTGAVPVPIKDGKREAAGIVLVSDVNQNRPRMYAHCHKYQERYDGWYNDTQYNEHQCVKFRVCTVHLRYRFI